MRLAVYCLTAAVLVGLSAGLPFTSAQVAEQRNPVVEQRAVYVDLAALAKAHPTYAALVEMDATLAEVESSSGEAMSREVSKGRNLVRVTHAAPGPSREQLVASAESGAARSLEDIEAEMQCSLRLRLESMRSALLAEAESALAPSVLETEALAAATVKALDEESGPGLVNAQLRMAALQAASRSPAIDRGRADMSAERARQALARLRDACDADARRAADAAASKIRVLREAEAAKIEAHLDSVGKSERGRIASECETARRQICCEMSSTEQSLAFARPTVGIAPSLAKGVSLADATSAPDSARLRAMLSSLRARIREDVRRAAYDLAREKRVRIVAGRNQAGLPDATDEFARVICRRGWTAVGPVLCRLRG